MRLVPSVVIPQPCSVLVLTVKRVVFFYDDDHDDDIMAKKKYLS